MKSNNARTLAALYRRLGKPMTTRQAEKILRDSWRDSGIGAGYVLQAMRTACGIRTWRDR